ncbi:hypothetical protein V865_004200 [Kwoniella europaea PYCC6329]|uniref:Uncharacterized protein n=1 Tax=Kwoniella europaea PYCC6329 TaxID=1423913 RepID=A0AAX4KKF7_9TREE
MTTLPRTKLAPSAGPSHSPRVVKAVNVVAANGAQTIRAQSKKDKMKAANGQDGVDRAGLSKDVVKAVLASPLTVAWPNIPRHLQNATLHALKEVVPPEVADYHVSRARCHQREKRKHRKITRNANGKGGQEKSDDDGKDVETMEGIRITSSAEDTASSGVGTKRVSIEPPKDEPAQKKLRLDETIEAEGGVSKRVKPEILSHMVLGINEVLKSLERQISDLRIRIMIMGDILNGVPTTLAGNEKGPNKSHLLPTAPRSPSLSPEPEVEVAKDSDQAKALNQDISPLELIIVPLLSINPPSLVSPIPQYCATYNTLVYQHNQLAKICKTRLKAGQAEEIVSGVKEEVRVVPLGAVEKEMAELVGLRRVACLGVRSSHPSISPLQNLLPKSVLHSPRHSITLPIPTSLLKVHDLTLSTEGAKSTTKVKPPIAGVHYADLHIKGIKTKMPVDNAARKAKRLEEVRRKRVEAKMKKKEMRVKGKQKEKQ